MIKTPDTWKIKEEESREALQGSCNLRAAEHVAAAALTPCDLS